MTTHAFTVDVEEYFHVHALERCIDRSAWSGLASRLDVGVDRLLDLLARHGATGTFFILGWVAHRSPRTIRRIADAGHEVASHGYWHRRVDRETPDSFAADVRDAREAIEQATGQTVTGYRAPSFSIVRESEWALDVLAATGHAYDSSRFPIHRRGYGSPHVPLAAHLVQTPAGPIVEIPLTVWEIAGLRIPAAGGGWFRQFPAAITRAAFAATEAKGRPGVFYIHPWELDPEQPVQPVDRITRLRHYRALDQTRARLDDLLARFRFRAIREVFAEPLARQRRERPLQATS